MRPIFLLQNTMKIVSYENGELSDPRLPYSKQIRIIIEAIRFLLAFWLVFTLCADYMRMEG